MCVKDNNSKWGTQNRKGQELYKCMSHELCMTLAEKKETTKEFHKLSE